MSDARALGEEVASVEALCRAALQGDALGRLAELPDLPHGPDGWFELLSGIPDDRRRVRALGRLAVAAAGHTGAGTLERHGVLQASLVALPRLASLAVDESVHWQFCAMVRGVAAGQKTWAGYFDHATDAFQELARIVTLRRFHAGQSSFDIMSMPRNWLLRVHPMALPAVVRELLAGLGGLGPVVMPHLNYWRASPTLLLRQENTSAMLRIARCLERQPRIKGLVAASWLYSEAVGDVSPHLAWVRQFYAENGACLVDMNPAAQRAGFLVGSAARRQLYAEGKFRPRETLVIWRRQDMLDWAARQGDETTPHAAAGRTRSLGVGKRLASGQITLLDCEAFMTFHPRWYVVCVFVVPAIVLAAAAAAGLGLYAVLPALLLAVPALWLFQYFCLQ